METHGVIEVHWECLRLPPAANAPRGSTHQDHCTALNGNLRTVRAGRPWSYLPDRYGWQSTRLGRGSGIRGRPTRPTIVDISRTRDMLHIPRTDMHPAFMSS